MNLIKVITSGIIHESRKIETKYHGTVILGEDHPEMVLENGSVVVFESTKGLYELIGDANIYRMIDRTVDLDYLLDNHLEWSNMDEINSSKKKIVDITPIFKFNIRGYNVYKI